MMIKQVIVAICDTCNRVQTPLKGNAITKRELKALGWQVWRQGTSSLCPTCRATQEAQKNADEADSIESGAGCVPCPEGVDQCGN